MSNKPLEKISIIPQDDAPIANLPQSNSSSVASMGPLFAMIERAARDPSIDMDKMLKLMALREQAETKQARILFDESVAAAKAQIPAITRNATGHNDKKYADFAAIARVVDPILGRHGLSYRFRTAQTDKSITVTCVLFGHGHSEENTLTAPPDSSGNKSAIHSIGSTLTYLQRYALVQALGLAASNDDDGNGGGNGSTSSGKIADSVPRLTQNQADYLRDLLETNGKDRNAFLRWAKVARIEDIAAAVYDSCVAAIEFKAPSK